MLNLYVNSNGKKLRCGYTTGSCATAAAKVATMVLFGREKIAEVQIITPKGKKLIIPIEKIEILKDSVKVTVIKDGGDDKDITNGLEICATVRKIEKGFNLIAGEGIGKVTKEGLFVKKGEFAINPTPRLMIESAVREVLPEKQGVEVMISVPKGAEVAQKTFNPRLGIKGGISILGTTGIVYPMSEEALKESIRLEIKQKSMEREELIFTIGNIGERCCLEQGFKEEDIVMISNFIGFALECATEENIKKIILVGHIGKVSKIAYGCFNTHSRVADVRLEVIALELALLGAPKELLEEVMRQKTSEGAVELLGDRYPQIYENICKKIIKRVESYTYDQLKCEVIMYSGYSNYKILYNSLLNN